jgi:hypothetical protein
MFDVTVADYLRYTQRYNVYHDGTEPIEDLEKARRRVEALHYKHLDLNPQTVFLYLGKAALNGAPREYRKLPFLRSEENVYVIPHPSGVNRVYNDADITDRTSLLLRSIWRQSQEFRSDSQTETD